ncbi:MAG: ABC transporter ATP-binding protein [Carnobacterium sp.]|uniref:ABC transporter ATP-binding protein n=1 Tax=Carnobacterium sp. TaxID=48221 RepID=UPI003C74FAB4
MMNKKTGLKPFISLIFSTKVPKTALIVGLLTTIITTLAGLAIPLLTKNLIDGFSLSSLSIPFISLIIATFILQALLSSLSMYLLAAVGQKIVADLREKMWVKLIRLPVTFFDKTSSGQMASRVVSDTGIVRAVVSEHFPQSIAGIFSIIGSIILLLLMDWKMTLLMLITIPLILVIIIPLGKQMTEISRGLQDETALFTGNSQQTLGDIRLMKVSTAESIEEKKGLLGIKNLMNFGLKEARIYSLIAPVIQSIIMFVIVAIIAYGGLRVSSGDITTGTLVAFLLYLFEIIVPITTLTLFYTELQKAKGATERIIDILDEPLEDGQSGISKNIAHQTIHIKNVSFSYEETELIINDISFSAKPGEMIALAGPSGGGKTTIFGLIERFYEPSSGEICIGDLPINILSMQAWRSQIGYVSQESSMMAGTIRENLTYGLSDSDKIADTRLWEVAKMSYSDQFIKQFPKGLDTQIGERGIKLSGGQRQRIAIARAFLRDPRILMMDEATASLDSQSEIIVQKALAKLMKGRTTFVIAHRLSTIVDADQILFLENGSITGRGTHDELIHSHPLYHSFAQQQLT